MIKATLRKDFGWGLKRMYAGLRVRRIEWGRKDFDYLYIKKFAGGTENAHRCIMYVTGSGEESLWEPDDGDLLASDYYEAKGSGKLVKKKKYRTR